MIRSERPPAPSILKRLSGQWLHKLEHAATPREKKQAQKKYRHPEIREALIRLFRGKCCYCEGKINHVDWGHIEHFRPQSRFPEFTFEWSNLLLACSVCNGNKGDQFPEATQGGPPLNPCADEPSHHLTFFYDPQTKLATVLAKDGRGEVTRDLVKLNREDLRAHRSNFVTRLSMFCEDWLATTQRLGRFSMKPLKRTPSTRLLPEFWNDSHAAQPSVPRHLRDRHRYRW